MGFLHLSFEYHKETLKVRVWQISDLLLPPPQLSMIHSIFVRSYFIPDKLRKTQRRTEEVVLDVPELSGVETPKTGIQHIFTPSSFKFRTPLQYRGVTAAVVKERSLQLEVCMRQKRTGRIFLMAMVHLPLSLAVRRPIREKHALIPCMNVTIPNNMRVYSAAQLELESSKGSHSPSIKRRVTAPEDEEVVAPVVTARGVEVEMEEVVSLSGEDFLRSHLSLCMDGDSDVDSDDDDSRGRGRDDDLQLTEVKVVNGVGSGASSTSSNTLNMASSGDDIDNYDDDDGDAEDDDDDVDDDALATVMVDKALCGGEGSISAVVDMRRAENSSVVIPGVKKKIIPYELMKADDDVAVNMPSEDVVVNMDMSSPHSPLSSYHPPPHPNPSSLSVSPYDITQSGTSTTTTTTKHHTRRKITPVELERDSVMENSDPASKSDTDSVNDSVSNREGEERNERPSLSTRQNSNSNSNTNDKNSSNNANTSSPPSARRKKILVLPGEVSIPTSQQRKESVSSSSSSLSGPSSAVLPRTHNTSSSSSSGGLSPDRKNPHLSPRASQDSPSASAFSPASRPETPCWDFYDWSEDLQAGGEGGVLELTGAAAAALELEQGLSQLREQGMGSLLALTREPILPMDLADDFDSLTVEGDSTTATTPEKQD